MAYIDWFVPEKSTTTPQKNFIVYYLHEEHKMNLQDTEWLI
jgi:hypothetical protein